MATSPARIMSEFSNPNLEPLITGEAIQARIRELGAQISRDYAGRNPLLIGVLKGAFIFLSDLMRAIEIPLGIEFIAISSYGAEMRTSGEVRILKDLDVAIEGRHILVVEDIVDTGLTLSYLLGFRRALSQLAIHWDPKELGRSTNGIADECSGCLGRWIRLRRSAAAART